MTCRDNRDGSCSVEYVPLEPGEYVISVRFADHHIPGWSRDEDSLDGFHMVFQVVPSEQLLIFRWTPVKSRRRVQAWNRRTVGPLFRSVSKWTLLGADMPL